MKHLYKAFIFIFALSITACERDDDNEQSDDSNNSVYSEDADDYTVDETGITLVEFLNTEASISGTGAAFSDSKLLISEAGTYQLSGTLDDGQVQVSASDESKVKIILDNVTINSSNNACIFVENSLKTIIILNADSENTLSDNTSYSDEDQNAVIFSKSDLAFSGEGQLTVNALYQDGITSKDGLIINSGSYTVTAVDDGIRGKDYLVINNGTFNINSNGDAIKSDNEDEGFGTIDIKTGLFNITTSADGIVAQSNLTIDNGEFTIVCQRNSSSAKALKAGQLVEINDGSFIIDSYDDAVHSDYDITINDGEFSIDTNDDGIHANNNLVIENATITINNSLEGIEANFITVNDGVIIVNASDDGFNATTGTNSMRDDGSQLIVNGGTITVNMSGNDVDAMDSNGDISINGGTVYLNLPTSGMSEALDANGTITIGSSATVYENGSIYTGSGGGHGGGW